MDLKAIADRAEVIIGIADPAQAATAYAVMKDETKEEYKEVPFMASRRTIMGALGVMAADALLEKLVTGINGLPVSASTKAYLLNAIDSMDGGGIDLANPETQAILDQFVASGVITATERDQLLAIAKQTVLAWPDLTERDVRAAFERRQAGVI